MATIEALIRQVRDRLGRPSREHLPDAVVLQFLYDRNQHYCSMLRNNSNEGYFLKRFPLVVSPGTDTYPLGAAAPDFAGAFLVTTDPDAYGDGRQREVQVVRVQDLDLTGGTAGSGDRLNVGADGAIAFAFYSDSEQWYAKVVPRITSGSYVVWYEPDTVSEQAMQNRPQMPASYHQMLAVSTALDCLALCSWEGMPPEGGAARANMLASSLGGFKQEMERQYDVHVRLANAQHTEFREPYASTPGMWGSYRGGGGW